MSVEQAGLDDAVHALLSALESLTFAQRHLHPGLLTRLGEHIAKYESRLVEAQQTVRAAAQSEQATALDTALELTLRAVRALPLAGQDPNGVYAAYRALRYVPYAHEALYALVNDSPDVHAFFLEPSARTGDVRAVAEPACGEVLHINNERGSKGGYSAYIPATADNAEQAVVFALHGGAGHGRGFLWTWMREARTRNIVLVTPTSCGQTWGLHEPQEDNANFAQILDALEQRAKIDRTRMLLTGMSDGGTFTFVSGLAAASPFSHLAPIAASFHPFMLEMIDTPKVAGRSIYLTHGVHDWMFQIDVARTARQVLTGLGAQLVYREIQDLAHTYPREENALICDWFLHGITPTSEQGRDEALND